MTESTPTVDITNKFAIQVGENLPNHSTSLIGRAKFVKPGIGIMPIFRTKQEAFRFCAWVMALAAVLPDEDGAHTFEEVLEAVQNV